MKGSRSARFSGREAMTGACPYGKSRFAVNLLPERNRNRPVDDPIFALNREATARRNAGETILNATLGALMEDDGSLAVMPSVLEALHAVPAAREAAYSPIAGAPEFLSAVVKDLLGGTPLAPLATAVATPGGSGALRHAVATFLERNQAMVTSSYYWGPYGTLCAEHERALRTFSMFDAEGRFDLKSLAQTLEATASAQGRVLLFLNDPCHNPTGYSMNDAEWSALRDLLLETASHVPTVVLCDVAYLAYARDQKGFLKYLVPLAEKGLVLFAWSASKSFTQYGLRVGALVACTADEALRKDVSAALTFACRGTWSNCNAGGQLAIARCLEDPVMRPKVDAERERLRQLLAARVGAFNAAAAGSKLRYPRYDGGFFVTIFHNDAKNAAETLKRQGIYVVPSATSLRVALCSVAERDVPRLVSALDATLA